MLADRRYRRYLNDNFSNPEWLRSAGLRQLLLMQAAVLALSLVFLMLNAALYYSYNAAWNFYSLQGALICGLVVVGPQANYAAASSPLLFEAVTRPATPLLPEVGPAPVALTARFGSPLPADGVGPLVLANLPETAMLLAPIADAPPVALPPELRPWRDRLLALMQAERPWLEPELAQRLRTNPSLLSKVINVGCRQNFNDFINTCRVAEARRKLADPRYAHYSLVGVALESGFNYKSTFNRVFRKLVGQASGELVRPKS